MCVRMYVWSRMSVCMYACTYVRICLCMFMYLYIRTYVRTHVRVYVCLYVHVYTYMTTCMYPWKSTHTPVHRQKCFKFTCFKANLDKSKSHVSIAYCNLLRNSKVGPAPRIATSMGGLWRGFSSSRSLVMRILPIDGGRDSILLFSKVSSARAVAPPACSFMYVCMYVFMHVYVVCVYIYLM
jgi:hypothetical protein